MLNFATRLFRTALTGQLKTEVRLTRFTNVNITCLKQFHKITC